MTNDITNNDPLNKFRIGLITVTVWKNLSEQGKSYYTTSIMRSYQDAEGEWKETNSFGHADLMNLNRLIDRAEAYIAKLSA